MSNHLKKEMKTMTADQLLELLNKETSVDGIYRLVDRVRPREAANETPTFGQALDMIQEENRLTVLHDAYMRMVGGDIVVSAILSRVTYWFSPGRGGIPRASIKRENKLWFAKTLEEWKEETGLSKFQIERSLKTLEEMGLIENRIFLYQRTPIKHTHLVEEKFVELYLGQRDK